MVPWETPSERPRLQGGFGSWLFNSPLARQNVLAPWNILASRLRKYINFLRSSQFLLVPGLHSVNHTQSETHTCQQGRWGRQKCQPRPHPPSPIPRALPTQCTHLPHRAELPCPSHTFLIFPLPALPRKTKYQKGNSSLLYFFSL